MRDTDERDPAAIHGIVREASTRLVAPHAARITVGGPDDPSIIPMSTWGLAIDGQQIDCMLAGQADFVHEVMPS